MAGTAKGHRVGRGTREVLRDAIHLLVLTIWSSKKVPGPRRTVHFREDEAAFWPFGPSGVSWNWCPHNPTPCQLFGRSVFLPGRHTSRGGRGCASCGRLSWLTLVPQGLARGTTGGTMDRQILAPPKEVLSNSGNRSCFVHLVFTCLALSRPGTE